MERSIPLILEDVKTLVAMYRAGNLGGDTMPEDVHPDLDPSSKDLCHYFTLPMALNYQRNSYTLWRGATATFNDPETVDIYDPALVVKMDTPTLWAKLSKHKVGLQSTRHTQIWQKICTTLIAEFDGDVRNLFQKNNNDIAAIRDAICGPYKSGFPYLSGPKISNYWLYVMSSYTTCGLTNRAALTIAPDTHVIQASCKLGMIENVSIPPEYVAEKWAALLKDTDLAPIDIHTPLWLWSRGGFVPLVSPKKEWAA